jgi:anaerobic selenocysteine-containing dehydrogenase
MSPEIAARLSGVNADAIRSAARLLWQHRPVAHFTWTGLEQQSNATQTDRAIAILHSLTGSIDVPGGNVHFAQVPVNDVSGNELRDATQWQKALGLAERPLGLGKSGWILSDDLYRAVIETRPYRVRALVGFGLNLLLSPAEAARGAEALRRLEFHVQSDLYLTPTAAYADIVLPVASAWEREGLRVGFDLDQHACLVVPFRPAVVAPRGEARGDIDIVFDLAVHLGCTSASKGDPTPSAYQGLDFPDANSRFRWGPNRRRWGPYRVARFRKVIRALRPFWKGSHFGAEPHSVFVRSFVTSRSAAARPGRTDRNWCPGRR